MNDEMIKYKSLFLIVLFYQELLKLLNLNQ